LQSMANGRVQSLIDQGGDFAIEWNQHMKISSGYSIMKGAQNLESAYRFLDYAMSPEVQARFSMLIPYGPTNAKAFAMISEVQANMLPTNPRWTDQGFTQNAAWWGSKLGEVTKAWNEWATK